MGACRRVHIGGNNSVFGPGARRMASRRLSFDLFCSVAGERSGTPVGNAEEEEDSDLQQWLRVLVLADGTMRAFDGNGSRAPLLLIPPDLKGKCAVAIGQWSPCDQLCRKYESLHYSESLAGPWEPEYVVLRSLHNLVGTCRVSLSPATWHRASSSFFRVSCPKPLHLSGLPRVFFYRRSSSRHLLARRKSRHRALTRPGGKLLSSALGSSHD